MAEILEIETIDFGMDKISNKFYSQVNLFSINRRIRLYNSRFILLLTEDKITSLSSRGNRCP